MMIAMIVLAVTGYLIGAPLPSMGGEATFSYYFATIRMIHFIAAMLFAVLFLLAMFLMYTLGAIVIILTGFSLYAEQYGWGSAWMGAFGWVNVLLGGSQMVRTIHHLTMWYLVLFAVVHMYMVFREDIMSGQSVVGTMINGIRTFKREPGR
jgi:Ni/Fe-hydrogenase 1 B-type cytochrome subunit